MIIIMIMIMIIMIMIMIMIMMVIMIMIMIIIMIMIMIIMIMIMIMIMMVIMIIIIIIIIITTAQYTAAFPQRGSYLLESELLVYLIYRTGHQNWRDSPILFEKSCRFPLGTNSRSNTNFSFQFIASYVWYSMEKLAGDLLFGSKLVKLSILVISELPFVSVSK